MGAEKLNEVEGQRRRFPLTGSSLLVLSVLLTAAVASLIYLSVNNQNVCRQLKETDEKNDIEANINIKSGNREKKENIKYSQKSRVAYYHGSDGSFGLDDFSKGIHIFRSGNGQCFVIPVGVTSSNDHSFETLLKKFDGKDLPVNSTYYINSKILPGQIEDVSMIPVGAHKECTNGYKWMIVMKNSISGRLHRFKRSDYYCCIPIWNAASQTFEQYCFDC